MRSLSKIHAVFVLVGVLIATSRAEEVTVASSSALRSAASQAKPGTTILVAAGNYPGGMHFRDVAGRPNARITIRGENPDAPPVFKGGTQAMHLTDCNYVTLADFIVDGCTTNGINCDDGGSITTPMHHVIVENVTIRHIGPHGNHDGLKMSGVDRFIIRDCRFVGWGGSAIDMVVFDRRVGQPEFINVGPGTAPETWKFKGNAWFDIEGNRSPRLPGTETGSIHQVDPKLVDIGKPTMRMTSTDSRLNDVGARAWNRRNAEAWAIDEPR